MSGATLVHANDFKRFYVPLSDTGPIPLAIDRAPPQLMRTTADARRDIAILWEKGYRPIGNARFTSEFWMEEKDALKFAKKIGAGYVIIYWDDKGSHRGIRTVTTPHSSETPVNVDVTGNFGRKIGTLTGSLTTQWTETETGPYTYTLSLFTGVYFGLVEKRGSGILLIPPTKEEAIAAGVGADEGAEVLSVRSGSPAYYADMLPGDVITALNGQALPTFESFNKIIAAATDAPIMITFYRKHVRHQAAMVIPPEWRLAGHAVRTPARIGSVPQR